MNASTALPRLLQIGSRALDEIAEVLGFLNLSKPLIVTDPTMERRGVARRLQDLPAAAGIPSAVFSDTAPEPRLRRTWQW